MDFNFSTPRAKIQLHKGCNIKKRDHHQAQAQSQAKPGGIASPYYLSKECGIQLSIGAGIFLDFGCASSYVGSRHIPCVLAFSCSLCVRRSFALARARHYLAKLQSTGSPRHQKTRQRERPAAAAAAAANPYYVVHAKEARARERETHQPLSSDETPV